MLKSPKLFLRKFIRNRWLVAALFIGLILLYLLISFWGVYRLIVSPNREVALSKAAEYGLTPTAISFESQAGGGVRLEGWWLAQPNSTRSIIMLHGQNSDRTQILPFAKELYAKGYNLLLFDMRGQGKSGGWNQSEGFFEQDDLAAAVEFVKSKGIAPASIGVYGYSMGAGVAVLSLSRTSDIKAVVADSPFSNRSERTQKRLGFFYPGVSFLTNLLFGFDIQKIQPLEAIKKVGQRKVLIIHGDQDKIIPVSDSYELQKVGGANVTLWVVPGAEHAAAFELQPAEYSQRVLAFFQQELQ